MLRFARHWRPAVAASFGMIAAAGTPALAAEAPLARAGALQAVVDCRTVSDPAQRLACYDAAAAKLDAAERSGEVVVVDKAQVQEARKATFGFSFKMPSFMAGEDGADTIDRVEGVITSAVQGGDGKWVLVLEDGAVWRQVDTERVPRKPKAGSKIEIRRAAMGSYKANIDGQTAIRVNRQN